MYLNTIDSKKHSKSWTSTIQVNGREVHFKLDTGAEVSVLTEETMNSLQIDRKQCKEDNEMADGSRQNSTGRYM